MAQRGRRIWWATWPGALGFGLVSLLMVTVTAVPLVAAALLPSGDVSGTDVTAAATGPALGWRLLWVVLGVACLAVPLVAVWVARRKWLGWLLLTQAVSAVVLGVGLAALNVI